MILRTIISLPLAATRASNWIDMRSCAFASLQLAATDLASPVGAVTIEYSNDIKQCEYELYNIGDPTVASTAARVDVTAALTVLGTALAAGYDGSGNKVSFIKLDTIGVPAYCRVVWTRTSGGATDTLLINAVGV